MSARGPQAGALGPRLLEAVRSRRDEIVDFLVRLAMIESPTDRSDTQGPVQAQVAAALTDLGFQVRVIAGRTSGGVLYARPKMRARGQPVQLLVGHTDTVWPIGTLKRMPVRVEDGHIHGPGTFDMKAGLTQIVFALRALRDLDLDPPATPVVLINSDEETGSAESLRHVERLSRMAARAYIMEPSYGEEGWLKTGRKGVGEYVVTVHGRAAHAGLNPGGGVSAILEMARVIVSLHSLSDGERGTTVNVGVVDGGIRPNVVAPTARAVVDVRTATAAEAGRVDEAIRGLRPTSEGARFEVSGGTRAPPMERTQRNRLLWERARRAGTALGLALQETFVGGGSDGNTTSQHTATLDGLGAVGDGAHAAHEHVVVDATVDRCALLAMLLLEDAESSDDGGSR